MQSELIWKKTSPEKPGDYICRMNDGYIKLCHFTGEVWLDMWKSTLSGEVMEWFPVPYSKEES